MESSSNRAHPTRSRRSMTRAVVVFTVGALLVGLAALTPGTAALLDGRDNRAQVLTGRDDDNIDNPVIQPAGVAANQSLNNTDVVLGKDKNDVLIGLLGSDVMDGGSGKDIILGGTEQGTAPNSDVMFGRSGNDVNVWAPGDGSDAFLGEHGKDALVFGVIDRENNVPTLSPPRRDFPRGVPTAEVTGSPGFCTIEKVTNGTARLRVPCTLLRSCYWQPGGDGSSNRRRAGVLHQSGRRRDHLCGFLTVEENPALPERFRPTQVDDLNETVDRIIR